MSRSKRRPRGDAAADKRPPTGPPDGTVEFNVDPRRLVWRLAIVWIVIEIGLIVFDYHINMAGVHIVGAIRRAANLAREDSLANLFAVIQVLLLALTCWAVWLTIRKTTESKWRRRGWVVVACLFSYMAIDDGSRLHERVGTAAKNVMEGWAHARGTEIGFPSYAWQVVYLPIFGALGLFTLVFLWFELKPKYSRLMVVTGISCFVAAVGMDFFEGLDADHRFNPYAWFVERVDIEGFTQRRFHAAAYETVRHFAKDIEEVTEMFGTTLIWMAVLRHWMVSVEGLRIRFSRD